MIVETVKTRKKRVKNSLFDPFRSEIEKCCDEGMTTREVFEKLFPAGYSYAGLLSYIKRNNVRGGAWRREIEARRVCDKCEYCKQFKNSLGNVNVAENRICTKSWRIINGSVRHCPRWCEYEGSDIEERVNGTANY